MFHFFSECVTLNIYNNCIIKMNQLLNYAMTKVLSILLQLK